MTILVTGATGNIGRRVVDHLVTLNAKDIRALTTNPTKAALPDSVTAITGYLGRPETLAAALADVDAVYLAPYPPTAVQALEAIAQSSASYVVALTGEGHWQALDDAVSSAGVDATRLGAGEFCDNFAMWATQIRRDGVVREPFPDHVQAPISMDDIARVAAHLLIAPDPIHVGRKYDLTGPNAVSRRQIAEQIGEGIGRPVTVAHCSRAEAEELLRPEMGDLVQWYFDLFGPDAHPQQADDLVARLTGTPAESMAQWAARNRTLFE